MSQMMRALVKREAVRGIWMEEVPVPTIGPNEVLIKVEKTAICGTDLHIFLWDDWSQRTIQPGLVIGHEFVGIVELVRLAGSAGGDMGSSVGGDDGRRGRAPVDDAGVRLRVDHATQATIAAIHAWQSSGQLGASGASGVSGASRAVWDAAVRGRWAGSLSGPAVRQMEPFLRSRPGRPGARRERAARRAE